MNDTLSEVLKEAYTLAPKGVRYVETLTIEHPSLGADTIYLIKDTKDITCTLEDSSTHLFKKAGFRLNLPPTGDNGVQEMALQMDNTDRRITDFIKKAKEYQAPVKVTFRPYLSTDFTTPQMNPPLTLNLTDIVVTETEISGKCTFADIINKQFLTELYTRFRFPGLAN